MHSADKKTAAVAPVIANAARVRAWARPKVSKMRAGDAEIGPNPDNADGAFTFS